MKKLLAIFLVFCVAFTLFSCGKGGSETPAGETSGGGDESPVPSGGQTAESPAGQPAGSVSVRDTLNVAMTQDRGTLDPSFMMGNDLLNAMRMVYEVLWEIDGEGNQIWLLATGLELVEPTVWRVTLRQGVTFANGSPFTADDVLFSLYRGNNRTGEPATFPVLNLDKSKALDEHTVEIVFDSYDLSYLNGFSLLYIFDKESFDEETVATTPNGTGPYEVTDYVINSHLDLTARDGYWGDKPAIENLHFAIMGEDSQRVTALQTGLVDIAAVPFQDLEFVQTLEGYNVDIFDNAQSRALYFSLDPASIFYENQAARQAVCAAIDTEAIVNIAYSGFGSPSKLPVSKGNVGVTDNLLNQGVYGVGYDPETAAKLAGEAGIVGEEIALITDGSSDMVVIAELIQADLNAIGIPVKVWNLDTGSAASVYEDPSQYDMCLTFTNVPSKTIAQNMYSWITFTFQGVYVKNPWEGRDRYLELTNDIMAVSDSDELASRYAELIAIHSEAAPWFSLCDMVSAYAYNSDIRGYNLGFMGSINYSNLSWGE
ncbi:MAG: ABC transporter substrate-binding protein [Oscillospiraceae bacterium]|jgi:peptide/nickel transport system substrate-binding protein|nr:ABC transporter substrate-binding protein [Oscillospiraceae bacterium]